MQVLTAVQQSVQMDKNTALDAPAIILEHSANSDLHYWLLAVLQQKTLRDSNGKLL